MTSYKNKQSGFTIVELLIVIVVIGILAMLVITTFTGIQQKARDTERQTDIKSLHTTLEAFWAQKAYYPTLAELNDRATFVPANLKGLDAEAFKDPKGTASALLAAPAANGYSYVPTPTGCATTLCTAYTLTATLEGTINGSTTFSKTSLNN